MEKRIETVRSDTYELPTKAYFRQEENSFSFERRTGETPIEANAEQQNRLVCLSEAMVGQIRRFCKLNAPTYAELCFVLSEMLTFVECNPTKVASDLDGDAICRNAFRSDPAWPSVALGAGIIIAPAIARSVEEKGYDATVMAISSMAGTLNREESTFRASAAEAAKARAATEDDFENAATPTNYSGQPVSAVEQIVSQLDRVDEADDPWCSACQCRHS